MSGSIANVRLSPHARYDIADAVDYYRSIHADLPAKFVDELEQLLQFIQLHPELYQRLRHHLSIRRAVMHHFPYVVAYDRFEGDIVVLRVWCSHKDPASLLP